MWQKGKNNTKYDLMKLGIIQNKYSFGRQWYEKARGDLLRQLRFKLALRAEM